MSRHGSSPSSISSRNITMSSSKSSHFATYPTRRCHAIELHIAPSNHAPAQQLMRLRNDAPPRGAAATPARDGCMRGARRAAGCCMLSMQARRTFRRYSTIRQKRCLSLGWSCQGIHGCLTSAHATAATRARTGVSCRRANDITPKGHRTSWKVERECMPKRRAARTHARKYVRVRHVCVSVTARVRECDCTCLCCECAGVSAMHK